MDSRSDPRSASSACPGRRTMVFAFFADARNLEALTPPLLRFRLVTPAPITMGAGTLIRYRLQRAPGAGQLADGDHRVGTAASLRRRAAQGALRAVAPHAHVRADRRRRHAHARRRALPGRLRSARRAREPACSCAATSRRSSTSARSAYRDAAATCRAPVAVDDAALRPRRTSAPHVPDEHRRSRARARACSRITARRRQRRQCPAGARACGRTCDEPAGYLAAVDRARLTGTTHDGELRAPTTW